MNRIVQGMLGGIGLVALFVWFNHADQSLAVGSTQLFFQPTREGDICPLSDSQQQNAIDAFNLLDNTLLDEPRCVNCHGRVQPFAPNTLHKGGRLSPIFKKGKFDPEATRITQCRECHVSPWIVTLPPEHWTNKTAVQLCRHMKFEFPTANEFINHMKKDAFGDIAFAGTRGLNEYGQAVYEDATKLPYKPEPPLISRARLVQLAQAWPDAMGGEFKGDLGCGCTPQHYALLVEEHLLSDFSANGASLHWDGSTQVQLPLTFKDDGSFTSQAKSERTVKVTVKGKVSCSGEVTTQVNWEASGTLDDKNKKIHFNIRFTQTPSFVDCVQGLRIPVLASDSENANNPLKAMEMPSFVGEEKSVNLNVSIPNTPADDTFKVTIIKVN